MDDPTRAAVVTAARHPGRTPAQRRVLDAIGCGNFSPVMAGATRLALLKARLIVELPPREETFIGGLKMTVRQFQMPIPTHMAWCDAMSAESSDDA